MDWGATPHTSTIFFQSSHKKEDLFYLDNIVIEKDNIYETLA